jgi:predicted flap endonuclease-1-like 5' DNA nuclease
MNLSPELFQAYLNCPTKCWLRAVGEPATGNPYAEWVKTQDETCRVNESARLTGELPNGEVAAPPEPETLKSARWQLATNVPVQAQVNSCPAQSCLHAVARVPSEGRGKPAQFIPIRFIYRNKLTKDDKLLLAFDAFVLSESIRREVSLGKIIHGDVRSCARESAAISQAPTTEVPSEPTSAAFSRTQPQVTKVKTSTLAGEVRKRLDKIAALLTNEKPPDLVLNRHCAECEFRDRCRQKAIETDDLSLLAGMSAKERQKLRSKGIFTVTQLSYTFRPRRRPKRLRDKREKYHHSLKALAIREQKIHIVGSPELKIEGTPVYLDVEGLPDRDFYYLIGLRIGHGDSAVQHSLWADTVADEGKIWREFLALLETVEKPVLIHYGSYETSFLKQMAERHGSPQDGSVAAKAIASPVNLVSAMFAQIYFPTYSNGLKEIAGWLGFRWSTLNATGSQSIIWRCRWEGSGEANAKTEDMCYNAEDCEALVRIIAFIQQMKISHTGQNDERDQQAMVVSVDSLTEMPWLYRRFSSPIVDLELINKAARWTYQRDRIYIRTDNRLKRAAKARRRHSKAAMRINEEITCEKPRVCLQCGKRGMKVVYWATRTLRDLRFSRCGLRLWIVNYHFHSCYCPNCHMCFGKPKAFWQGTKFGSNVSALLIFKIVDLCMQQRAVTQELNRLYQLGLHERQVHRLKAKAADFYEASRQRILANMLKSNVIHADETRIVLHSQSAYVWVFTSLREVAYFYSESREGDLPQKLLDGFKGVLVSDFYATYDSIPCPQQKCLIHLMRDLNDVLLGHPYDDEVRGIVSSFAGLLKTIVETTDHRGLKRHFLRKHLCDVERFYGHLSRVTYQSEVALNCKKRFEKNQERLFTFLNHDGVPWNNNNAEHAIKAFARLRRTIEGLSTPKGIEEYVILLSVCQTCKYMGVDFLDFLRSGEKDIHAFAESRRRRRKLSVNSKSAAIVSGTPSGESQPF